MMQRSSWTITGSVWRALFLREALYRLFHRRAAWLWLFLEPIGHIAFLMLIFTVLRVRVVGGMDTEVWIMVGLLGFFMFRRTMTLSMAAIGMSRPLYAYRQVKPVDAVLVRGASEGMLMLVITLLLFGAAALLGLYVWPDDLLLVAASFFALWLLGLGVGLLLSVPRELAQEVGEVVNLITTPLYLLSGVIFPLSAVPQPYRDWLLLNPIAHGLEALRLGFAGHYAVFDGLDLFYTYLFGLVCVFLGLALHRVFRNKMLQL